MATAEAPTMETVDMEGGSDSESRRRRRGRAQTQAPDDAGAAAEQQAAPATTVSDALLEAEREKARKRAERFGLPYVEPTVATVAEPEKHLTGEELIAAKAAKRLEVLRQRREKEAAGREGFYTGFDTLSAEEIKKKEERAAKYGVALMGVTKEDAERVLREKSEAEAAEAARKKREERFGVVERPEKKAAEAEGMDIDFLERPVDAAPNAEVRPEVVHLYGTDTMSTNDCMAYFKDYAPVFVEWINDSSCNVVFVDAFTAKRAMHGVGKKSSNPVPGAAEAEGEIAEDRQWFKGPDFIKSGVAIPLSFRLATVLDAKVKKTKSRYLWLAQPPGLGIPAGGGGGGRKRRQRDAGEGVDAMETADGEAGNRKQRRRKQKGQAEAPEADKAEAPASAEGAAPAAQAEAEPKAPIITEDLRKAVLAAKSALAAAAAGGGRRLAMDAEGGDDDAVPDFGNDGL